MFSKEEFYFEHLGMVVFGNESLDVYHSWTAAGLFWRTKVHGHLHMVSTDSCGRPRSKWEFQLCLASDSWRCD